MSMPSFSWKALWAKGWSTLIPTSSTPFSSISRLDLLVDRELVGADRAEVERVEDEQDLAAAEVGERDLVAVLVAEGEVGRRLARRRSSAQAELGDQGAVALEVVALEVAQHAAALADQHQQAAARVVVLGCACAGAR